MVLETRRADRAIIVCPPEPGVPRLFADRFPEISVLYADYGLYTRDEESRPDGVRSFFRHDWEGEPGAFDLAVIFFPKEKDLAELMFASVSAGLRPEGDILVVGPNRGGIRTAGALMERYFGPVRERRSARHAVLLSGVRTVDPEPYQGMRRFTARVGDAEITAVSLPGVFSHGELDEGTALLLEALGSPQFERALDWGCGSGVVGAALALGCPGGNVDFADSSPQALEATRLTLEANSISGKVMATDVFSGVPGRYDLIVTNPPFHEGLRTTTDVTGRMIQGAGEHLNESGRLVLVSNSFLRYEQALREHFGSVRTLVETTRFRVHDCRRS
jgi:16S rRNA (guanine1207-N2)-methyltransferase